MAKIDVLICGSGIAGPALIYWLAKSKQEFAITIMERAPRARLTGQAIDIRGAAVEIIREMRLEETIRAHHSSEKGLYFVDSKGKPVGVFPATGSTEKQGFTSEFEIQRSDLSKIFQDTVQDKATWVFGEYVSKIEQPEDGHGRVHVEYTNGRPAESFDLIIGADGLNSKTRQLAFGSGEEKDWLHQVGQFGVLFTIPYQIETGDGWARWFSMTGGKAAMIRPDNKGQTAAYFAVTRDDLSKLDDAARAGPDELKRVLREEFKNGGWAIPQLLDGMDASTDLYHSRIAQVKMESFVSDRIGLLGDAAFCPSPITGQGTSLALLGAYILGGELSNIDSASDIPAALQRYQEIIKPQAQSAQKLMPGAPQIVCPQTQTGITIMHTVLRIMSFSFVQKILFGMMPSTEKTWKPPVYERLVAA